jgi:hypothetical protein
MVLIDLNVRFVAMPGGKPVLIPALASEEGIFMPLLWYFEEMHSKLNGGTLERIRHALKLFALYTAATAPEGFGTRRLHGREHATHFRRFRDAIVHGTVNEETGEDPSQLRWAPGRVAKANQVTWYLTNFFKWMDRHGSSNAQRFNPVVTQTRQEKVFAGAAYEHRRSRAFLGHSWKTSAPEPQTGRHVGRLSESGPVIRPTKRFPEDAFVKLLLHGFTTRSVSNLRDILIAILLNKGGLRVSEVMHLWLTDVNEDPSTGMAIVSIPHPSDGPAPGRWGVMHGTRSRCLESEFKRRPRNLFGYGDPEYAGWKSRTQEIEVLWCEPAWGTYFLLAWKVYVRRVQQIVPSLHRRHPYAFMALQGKTTGRPLTIEAYRDAHKKAVQRANLVPSEGSANLKQLGLTMHGHRHAYGHRAKNVANLSRDLVKDMMNHRSVESQDVYTRLTWSEKMEHLVKASKFMHEGFAEFESLVKYTESLSSEYTSLA